MPKLDETLMTLKCDQQNGRYVVASKDIDAGTLILNARPYGIVWYCSQACMDTASVFHKEFECARLAEISALPSGKGFRKLLIEADAQISRTSSLMQDAYERSDIIEMARWLLSFCIRVEMEKDVDLAGLEGFPTYSDFKELVPNMDSVSNEEISQLHGLHYLFSRLKPPVGQTKQSKPSFSALFISALPHPEDLIRVICIKQCNGFGLWDQEGECMGYAIYPSASFFNHSCDKNLERVIGMKVVAQEAFAATAANETVGITELEGPRESCIRRALELQVPVVLHAKRAIQKGQLITHSYVDQSWDREKRRQYLKDVYYFDCVCERCEAEK
ncbi:hypothetical protein HDU78_010237 [Chytriomyces hyalinus]|nr:hypothetical protein HDU78_010237 [Chytriomyces hyalinus]